ncbi:amidohydrolase [Leifsonia sp. TF02-11]|uniref:amidohydrolase family protein n=1 Tax=Leifsonia sp. TF02-11 TaxID=2815212 RepID=UPI001AA1622A|nr:amidohydrolase family protein [Leifsonia sp. TF02-11]MBO1741849.1 amidohydrolase family protein [Leifsonia sp. TF02-11]
MRVIDGHLHLWDPAVLSYPWLAGPLLRPFGPDELDLALAHSPAAERGFVFVQAECVPEQAVAEVDWVASLADRVPLRGIVARATLEDPAAMDELLPRFAARPLVVGVRRPLEGEADDFCIRPTFIRSAQTVAAAGLAFDACVRPRQLPRVGALADAVPDLAIVLDHLGKPEVDAAADVAPWARELRELARRPNVSCKLSGLPAQVRESAGCDVSAALMRPLLDVALDAFGPDRLLFGSDWPVSREYGRWFEIVRSWLTGAVDAHHVDAVLAGNAERVYRLG